MTKHKRRSRTKAVTLEEAKHYMEPGFLEARACCDPRRREHNIDGLQKMDAITFEVNHCTAFMSDNEALQLVVSLSKAGHTQWGDEWLGRVRTWLERIE